jgi:hypothetical protein
MTIPGFTAEASLTESSGLYRSGARDGHGHGVAGFLRPAGLGDITQIQYCKDGIPIVFYLCGPPIGGSPPFCIPIYGCLPFHV